MIAGGQRTSVGSDTVLEKRIKVRSESRGEKKAHRMRRGGGKPKKKKKKKEKTGDGRICNTINHVT